MMTVPLRHEPNQSLQIVLGEQNCTLRFISRGVNLYCYFVDMQGEEDPHWSGLGDRFQLVYVEEGETL